MSAIHLNTQPNLDAPDPFYEALIETHRDLSEAESHALNARLVLLLANHIGHQAVLLQALQAARASGRSAAA
ncbi:MAG: hypothetical protein RIQ60_1169 [Pseudomonadota bacterium]|jgi:hypothetical protein